jgi:hypothetical protein
LRVANACVSVQAHACSSRSLPHGADGADGVDADEHISYVFLLDEDSGVHPVPHALYVALARGQATAPALVGRTLRLADWYVREAPGEAGTVVNETYSLVRFDAQGRVDWPGTPAAHPHRPGTATVPEAATIRPTSTVRSPSASH